MGLLVCSCYKLTQNRKRVERKVFRPQRRDSTRVQLNCPSTKFSRIALTTHPFASFKPLGIWRFVDLVVGTETKNTWEKKTQNFFRFHFYKILRLWHHTFRISPLPCRHRPSQNLESPPPLWRVTSFMDGPLTSLSCNVNVLVVYHHKCMSRKMGQPRIQTNISNQNSKPNCHLKDFVLFQYKVG